MKEQAVEQRIAKIRDVWTREAAPDKIILFGSAARGNWQHDSDLDFLVVWGGGQCRDNIRRAAFLRMLLIGKVRGGVDILVLTPEEFQVAAADPLTFTATIVREGKVLYERVA